MFFHSRRRPSLLPLLMLLFGFKFLSKERMSESERDEYKEKRKTFRRKMREAFAVWDEDEDTTSEERA